MFIGTSSMPLLAMDIRYGSVVGAVGLLQLSSGPASIQLSLHLGPDAVI